MTRTATVAVDVPAQRPTVRKSTNMPSRPESKPEPERIVDGQAVVEERPVLSNLPVPEGRDPVDFAMRGYTELILADGTSRFSCADCDHISSRGALMKHRGRMHRTQTKPRARAPKAETNGATVLPSDLRSMSLGDVLEMGSQVQQLGVVVENVTAQRDEYKERCVKLEQQLRRIYYALAKAGFEPTEDAR